MTLGHQVLNPCRLIHSSHKGYEETPYNKIVMIVLIRIFLRWLPFYAVISAMPFIKHLFSKIDL
jgi:hypothetical protein